jgi:hypothetical protein
VVDAEVVGALVVAVEAGTTVVVTPAASPAS